MQLWRKAGQLKNKERCYGYINYLLAVMIARSKHSWFMFWIPDRIREKVNGRYVYEICWDELKRGLLVKKC